MGKYTPGCSCPEWQNYKNRPITQLTRRHKFVRLYLRKLGGRGRS